MKRSNLFPITALILCAALFTNCKREPKTQVVGDSAEVPDLPEKVYDYPNSSNDHLATLGRVLFYDKELSANKNISCGSCHRQENAFADAAAFSKGTNNSHTKRNSPAIFAKNGRVFWDGRSGSIRDLVLMPVKDEVEMNFPNIQGLVNRISKLDYYNFLFKNAFPGSPTEIDSVKIKMALEEFVKNFSFSNNKFHQSQKGAAQLTPSEQMGASIFMGKARCASCHHIQPNATVSNGYGVTDESHNIGLDETNNDLGVGGVTKRPEEMGEFMMPVLLNVALTAPYMHDGRFETLEEVVDHYNENVKDNPTLDPILREMGPNSAPRKLRLSDDEKKGLVDFLKALTDPSVLTDPKFSNPFVQRP